MCKANMYYEQFSKVYNNDAFSETYKEMCKDITCLTGELQRLDLAEQDILHYIENDDFHASQGYVYAREIQKTRRLKRDVKNEKDLLTILKTHIDITSGKLKGLSQSILSKEKRFEQLKRDKVYTPRIIKKESVTVIMYR